VPPRAWQLLGGPSFPAGQCSGGWVTGLLRVRETCWAGDSSGPACGCGAGRGQRRRALGFGQEYRRGAPGSASPGSPRLFVPAVLRPADRRAVRAWSQDHHPAAPHALRRGTGEEFPAGVSGLGGGLESGASGWRPNRAWLLPGAGSPAWGDGSVRGHCRLCCRRNRRVEVPLSQPPQRGVQDPLPAARGPVWAMSVP